MSGHHSGVAGVGFHLDRDHNPAHLHLDSGKAGMAGPPHSLVDSVGGESCGYSKAGHSLESPVEELAYR